jgi:O-antigen ligase
LNLAAIYEKHRDRALLLTGCMLSLGMLTLTTAFLAGCVAALIQARPLNVFEIVPGFSNIRFLNQIQTWSIPLLALCVFARTRPPRLLVIASYTAISGSWLILFATGARGSMLALATASVLSVLVLGRRTRPFLKLQGIGLLAGFLAERLIFHLAPRWFGLGESLLFDLGRTSDTGRIALWKQAWALLAENPLLGIGPQHFAWFENAFSLAHPHNAPLQIASEWGLPGALLLAALLGWGFLRWTSTARDQPPGADPTTDRAILWIALVAGATHSLLAGIIVMPLSQLLMTIVCAAALGTHMAQGESRGSATAGGHVATRLAAGFLLVLLLVSMGPELATRLSGDELLPAGRVVLGPRIWQLGGIPH